MSDTHNKDKATTPQEIDKRMQELNIEKSLLIQNQLISQDPEQILKAQLYLNSLKQEKTDPKAYFFAPDMSHHGGRDYKDLNKSVPDNVLRKVSYIPIVDSIIKTKINQISNYLKFTTDETREGFTIRKKMSRFVDRKREDKGLTKVEQKTVDGIVDFLESSGTNSKWSIHDDLLGFVGKILRDSFTFNRATFELERNKKQELLKYCAIDAQTIRLLETIDPYYQSMNPQSKYIERPFKGESHLPRYCQIWNGEIVQNPVTKEQVIWYPWELAFEIRNQNTDIWRNGYGTSEIEILSQIITWLLNGLQYNGNFFTNGSNATSLINIKNGGGAGQQVMNQLRQMWTTSISGVGNSHRTPVVEGLDLEILDLKKGTNKDMEFQMWNEFLIVLTCAVFNIDPTELGFQFKTQSNVFGQDGQHERLEHSKEKGLKPILIFLQKILNKYIISEITEEYEFIFTGIDLDDESQYIDNDVKKLTNGGMSMEDFFSKYSKRDFDPEKDTILNQVYQQIQQQKMYGGQDMNEIVDEETGEASEGTQNPFEEFDKSEGNNPVWSSTKQWLKDNNLIQE